MTVIANKNKSWTAAHVEAWKCKNSAGNSHKENENHQCFWWIKINHNKIWIFRIIPTWINCSSCVISAVTTCKYQKMMLKFWILSTLGSGGLWIFQLGVLKLALFNWKKLNGLQGNGCILWRPAWGQQKLGIISGNELPQNLKFEKDVINKSFSST